MSRDELIVRLMALLELKGIGPSGVNRLRSIAGSIERLVVAINGGDSEPLLSRDPTFRRICAAWNGVSLGKYFGWLTETMEAGHHIVLADDPSYPVNLHGVTTAPPLLYVWGALEALRPRSLALVGSVDPTKRGTARAAKMAALCTAHDIQVVSGLARGIDGASHRAALATGAPTFAVVGHGLRHMFPPEHQDLASEIAERGAVISQFAPEVRPARWTFPARNELMCTIAKGTVIVEIERDQKFGSVIQARFSNKHGRPVFILHSNIVELHSEMAQQLVQNGDAVEVREFRDVLNVLETSSPTFALHDEADLFSQTLGETREQDVSHSRAILFDMDGVIANSALVSMRAYQEAFRRLYRRELANEEVAPYLTKSPYVVCKQLGGDYARVNPVYNQAFTSLVDEGDCIFVPVASFIIRAKRAGYKIGLITRQPRRRVQALLNRGGIMDSFDVTITYNDIPKGKGKPNPFAMKQALSVLGVEPEHAVYIGDTPDDVEFAKRARVKSVAVGWGFTPAQELMRFSPDLFAAEFAELDVLLEDWAVLAG